MKTVRGFLRPRSRACSLYENSLGDCRATAFKAALVYRYTCDALFCELQPLLIKSQLEGFFALGEAAYKPSLFRL